MFFPIKEFMKNEELRNCLIHSFIFFGIKIAMVNVYKDKTMKTMIHNQDLLTISKVMLPYDLCRSIMPDDADDLRHDMHIKDVLKSLGVLIVRNQVDVPSADTQIIIDLTRNHSHRTHHGYEKESYHYINNPDGSIRWIFPTDLAHPTFLSFYNISTWKAKALSKGLNWVFKFGLQKWFVSGSFDIYFKNKLTLRSVLGLEDQNNYSIFLGTVGPNRKVVIEINDLKRTTHFVKTAISDQSSSILENEYSMLNKIQALGINRLMVPEASLLKDDVSLVQTTVCTPKSERSMVWTSVHSHVKIHMEETSITKDVSIGDFVDGLKEQLRILKWEEQPHTEVKNLISKVDFILGKMSVGSQKFAISLNHNDFTPWNMYLDGDRLCVYDWELAGNAPVFSDLFHFHIQKGVMIDRKTYGEIWNEIVGVLETAEWQHFIKKHEIDVSFQFYMFLLKSVTYYLGIYNSQPKLHWQALALLKVWESALDEVSASQKNVSFRRQFIPVFFEKLQYRKYALLKFIYNDLDLLPESSDLDILISEQDLQQGRALVEASPLVSKVKWFDKSFMTTAHIFFKDGSFLNIDFLTSFKRTHQILFSAKEVLADRQLVNGLYVPNPKHDFEYTLLFYQLNGSKVPDRYATFFGALPLATQKEIEAYISDKYFTRYMSMGELFEKDEELCKHLDQSLFFSGENLSLGAFANLYNYVADTLKGLFRNKGFVITVSGVDGAGKSTVIGEIKNMLEHKYRKKVIVLRHRPSVLPILSAWVHGREKAEQKSASRLPRQGTNRSVLKSALRFAYYYTDYVFGQLYVYVKHTLRGKIVVYDRYYFDFINDAKRSNIALNPSIPKLLYTLVYKPDINIFLHAPASVILQRKQELDIKDIESLTVSYQQLFDELSQKSRKSQYLSILNIQLQQTLQVIESRIIKIA